MVHCVIAVEDKQRGREHFENPFYVSAAENSYAGEKSYKTGLPLSDKKNNINIYNKHHYL